MNASTSLHGIKSISCRYEEGGPGPGISRWIDVTFTAADGSHFAVTAFVDGPIKIQGAEFINHMAAHEPPPESSLAVLLRASIDIAKRSKAA